MERKLNNNITILRDAAIVCIVMHHVLYAFHNWPAQYTIGTQLPIGLLYAIPILRHIGLACFTFISGYVLYYQSKKEITYNLLLINKIRRLIIPCVVYALLYWSAFSSCLTNNDAINGTHLWYLPMIFLCCCILATSFYTRYYIVVIAFFYILFRIVGQFYYVKTFASFCEFIPVFYMGYLFNKYSIEDKFNSITSTMYGVVIILLSILLGLCNIQHVYTIQMCLTSIGAYLIICGAFNKKTCSFIDLIAKHSFTIYLLHEFVICTIVMHIDLSHINVTFSIVMLFCLAFFFPIVFSQIYGNIKEKLFFYVQNREIK